MKAKANIRDEHRPSGAGVEFRVSNADLVLDERRRSGARPDIVPFCDLASDT